MLTECLFLIWFGTHWSTSDNWALSLQAIYFYLCIISAPPFSSQSSLVFIQVLIEALLVWFCVLGHAHVISNPSWLHETIWIFFIVKKRWISVKTMHAVMYYWYTCTVNEWLLVHNVNGKSFNLSTENNGSKLIITQNSEIVYSFY